MFVRCGIKQLLSIAVNFNPLHTNYAYMRSYIQDPFRRPWKKDLRQGGKRLGDETSSPLFKRCVMRRRTGTSALSALPVRLVAGKIYLSTNRKSHFLSLFFSQPCTMIKTFFHSPGSQLKMLLSAWTLVNLFHSKFPKNALKLRVSNACSCRKT